MSARRAAGCRGEDGSSRDAFIRATARLLRRQGYAATGLNEIVASSGAPRGSLYFHFPGGKEELAAAAISRSGEQLREAIAMALASSEDLPVALGGLLDGISEGLARSGYREGCPVATVALEQAAGSDALAAATAGAFASWIEVLRERLVASGLAPTAAARRAVMLLAAIEGALILARARRDPAPLAHVREELIALCS